MASLIYIPETSLTTSFNPNLLNEFMMFNGPFTWNVATGSATSHENIDQFQYEGSGCLRIYPNAGALCVVNSGGSETEHTIAEDGNYIFSIKHKNSFSSTGATQNVGIRIYVNGVSTDYLFLATKTNNDLYRTYYQNIALSQGDVVSFEFVLGVGSTGGLYKHFFDGFKLEKDTFGYGTPSVFTYPGIGLVVPVGTADGLYGVRITDGVPSLELL